MGGAVDQINAVLAERGLTVRDDGSMLVGLAGRGIQLSRTPGMHEREARRLGVDYSYVLLDFDRMGLPDSAIGDVIEAASSLGFRGLNITHPFKQLAIPSMDRMSPEAAAIGAMNTAVFDPQQKSGHNTDSWGYAESFRDGMAGAQTGCVALFGAGGAGAAVAYALMELGTIELSVIDSDASRAASLVARMQQAFGNRVKVAEDAASAVRAADGVVNTTPVGMAKYPGAPFDTALLTPQKWVSDIIYFPAETELLRRAHALGCRTLPGIGMAIYQAVRAFELFSGRKADHAAMARHFEAAA
jgi:shikimate dehydrogenase